MSEPLTAYEEFLNEADTFMLVGASVKETMMMAVWKLPTWSPRATQHIEQLPMVFSDHDYELAIGGV